MVFKLIRKRIAFIAISASVGGIGFYSYTESIQTRRFLYFCKWRKGISDEQKSEEYGIMHLKYATEIFELISHLKGFYIKIGQLAAQRLDVIPFVWAEKLKKLEDEVEPQSYKIVVKIIEENFDKPLEEVFHYFDPIPIGSASTAQVHKATLKKTRKEVAVKVLNREAKRFFRMDIKTILLFTRIAQPQLLPFVQQCEPLLAEEFDCRKEAQKMEKIRQNLKYWRGKVAIPEPLPEFCTDEVLVMDFLEGKKLSNSIFEILNAMRAKSKTGNYFKVKQKISRKTLGVMNFKEAVQMVYVCLLEGVHAQSLFYHGTFNPDPHGGNILLLSDGRIGLIDYGQVRSVDRIFQQKFARLIISIDSEDWAAASAWIEAIGFETEKGTEEVRRGAARLLFGDGNTGKLIFSQYLEELFWDDPLVNYPSELFLVGKMMMILRGIAMSSYGRVNIAAVLRPFAEEFLRRDERM